VHAIDAERVTDGSDQRSFRVGAARRARRPLFMLLRPRIHNHELTDVGDSEQATGNHSDRPSMGTKRRLAHENLP
jgi:hypothetical protein